MNSDFESGTALLAALVGTSLLTATAGTAQGTGTFDAHQAREISVLARVLEKRLGDVRRSMADRLGGNVAAVPVGRASGN